MKFLLSILILFCCFIVKGQSVNINLKVKVLTSEGKPFNQAIVQSYKNDILFSSDTSKSNGKIDLIELPIGSKYNILISKQGYVSKIAKIDADTSFNTDLVGNYIPIQFQVELIEECDAGAYEFTKTQPFIIYKLNSDGVLEYDKDSLKVMLKKMDRAKYANLSAEDHESFITNYNGGIEQMEIQNHSEGLELLLKAKEIVDCPYVINKIAECKNLQLEQENYEKSIIKANQLFNDRRYTQAYNEYDLASKIKPNETYPINQMKECVFRKILAQANKYFDAEDYAYALRLFDRALSLKPTDTSFQMEHAQCREKVK